MAIKILSAIGVVSQPMLNLDCIKMCSNPDPQNKNYKKLPPEITKQCSTVRIINNVTVRINLLLEECTDVTFSVNNSHLTEVNWREKSGLPLILIFRLMSGFSYRGFENLCCHFSLICGKLHIVTLWFLRKYF